MCPAATDPRHSSTEIATLISARPIAPARMRSNVCKLNDEKVVNPPHTPTIKNSRAGSGAANRPCASVSVPKKLIANEPAMLMPIVPQGSDRLSGSAHNAIQYRAVLPSAPPRATKSVSVMPGSSHGNRSGRIEPSTPVCIPLTGVAVLTGQP